MDEQTPRRSGIGVALLAGLVISGSAIGVMLWQLSQKEKPASDAAGFDLTHAQERAQTPATPLPAGRQAPEPSGLSLLQVGNMGGKVRVAEGGGGTQNPAPKPAANASAAASFTDSVRRNEPKARDLAVSYTKRYPVISRYGRDWMGYPDLKKLNDDYMRDHDPVKFLHGLARSEHFGKLVLTYAKDPAVQSFVKEVVREAPGEVTAAACDLLDQDGMLRALLSNTAKTMGLPESFTAALMGKVDQKQVMGQVMQGNPELQKAADNPDAQKAPPSGFDPNRGR